MMNRLLSDRGRGLKLALLALLYLGLAVYYQAGRPDKGAQWVRVFRWAASPAQYLGQSLTLTHARVDRLLPQGRGAVVVVGPPGVEVTVLGLTGGRPGQRADLRAVYQGGSTFLLEEVRLHASPRWLKLGVSLLAAFLVLVLFFRAFTFKPGRGALLVARKDRDA